MSRLYLALLIVVAVVCGATGSFIGYHWEGDRLAIEDVTPAAAITQGDGSVVLPRVAPPIKPPAPPHRLPAGAKEERRVSVTVKPAKEDCPPVRLDLSLAEIEGGKRVITSSPDGEVIDGRDIPLAAAFVQPKPKLWAAGVSWAPREELGGIWVERDIKYVRIGADVEETTSGAPLVRARIGLRF